MNKTLRELQARKAKHVAAMRAISDKASKESRELTDEEVASFDAEKLGSERVSAAIERESALIEAEKSAGVVVADDAVITGGNDRKADDKKHGFQSFGEFAAKVRDAAYVAANGRGAVDSRLTFNAAAPTTYGNEQGGVDSGFVVPPQFSEDIFRLSVLDEDSLLGMSDQTTVSSNGMVFPKDETTPWGTDGVRAFWQAEASAATQTKPKFGTQVLRLHKLMALVPVSDELLGDTNALNSYLPTLMARSILWKLNESIMYGTGAGQPLGCFTGAAVAPPAGVPALVVPKDSGQATLTLSALNVANMVARLPAGSYRNAVWIIGPDTLPALFTLTLGNYPIYIPTGGGVQGGVTQNPYGMLLGRPIMVSQHAPAFSALGDVSLADFSYYRTITKAGGMSTASSQHLFFDADATAFRTTFRVDGQPKIQAPITQAKGINKLSPFVQLQNR